MCGKFTMMMSWRELRDLSELTTGAAASGETMIGTPMRMVPVIHLDDDGKRVTEPMRWGFADARSKTPMEKPRHMHARGETVDTLPTFADSFAFRRGIIVARTFNVGQEMPNGKVIQHTITPRDGKPIALGVIWERWLDRNEGSLLTFVMVTTAPNKLIAIVTDRQPAIIPQEHWPLWLGETKAPLHVVKELLVPFEGDWDMEEQARPSKTKPTRPAKKETEQPTLI